MANYPLLGDSLVDGENKPNVLFRYRPDGTGLIMIRDNDFDSGIHAYSALADKLLQYQTNNNLTFLRDDITITGIRYPTNLEIRHLFWEFALSTWNKF